MSWRVPLFDTDIGPKEIQAVTRVMESGWLTMGPETAAFEEEFARYIGSRYAFMVSNCTAALHLAHEVLSGGVGGEVICPSLSFVATANTIIHAGCTPVFTDCAGTDDLTISHSDIEKKITSATKGITVMHYGGHPCAMEEILDIARRHNLYIVEDCAHSPGASIKGRMTGTFGDIGCFSFFSNKNLSTGEGGMIVTDRDDLAEMIRLLRSHGMTTLTLDRYKGHAFTYNVTSIGYNYRSSEINAAIGRIQLVKLAEKNQKRQDLCRSYIEKIQQKNVGRRIVVPFEDCQESSSSSWHIFVILLPENVDRIRIMELIRKEGVQTSIHYPPIHMFKAFQQYANGIYLPVLKSIESRLLTLPLYPSMCDADVDFVVGALDRALKAQ